MKTYTITVNGNVYNVTVEEGQTSGAPAAAPVAAPKAAPAAAPKAAAPAVPAKKASKGKKNSGSSEDDISLFYLMQHYSKENKEKYKAAKERKKSGNTATEAPVAKKQASVI